MVMIVVEGLVQLMVVWMAASTAVHVVVLKDVQRAVMRVGSLDLRKAASLEIGRASWRDYSTVAKTAHPMVEQAAALMVPQRAEETAE